MQKLIKNSLPMTVTITMMMMMMMMMTMMMMMVKTLQSSMKIISVEQPTYRPGEEFKHT